MRLGLLRAIFTRQCFSISFTVNLTTGLSNTLQHMTAISVGYAVTRRVANRTFSNILTRIEIADPPQRD